MKKSNLLLICLSIFIVGVMGSCVKTEHVIVEGMAPIYISPNNFSLIKTTNPKAFGDLGSIVNVGNYIFLNEKYKGIHVLDNTDPNSPTNIHFWEIPGNLIFTIEQNILYADNSIHLLVIDISDFGHIQVVDHIKDLYINTSEEEPNPPNYKGPFECVSKSKGIYHGWETKLLTNPLCESF